MVKYLLLLLLLLLTFSNTNVKLKNVRRMHQTERWVLLPILSFTVYDTTKSIFFAGMKGSPWTKDALVKDE